MSQRGIVVNTPAAFGFNNYRITHIEYIGQAPEESDVDISIDPGGSYDSETGRFNLVLRINIDIRKTGGTLLTFTAEGHFHHPQGTPLDKIEPYFYPNAIAILFTYIRAAASNIVMIANERTLFIPLLNLNLVGTRLRELMEAANKAPDQD